MSSAYGPFCLKEYKVAKLNHIKSTTLVDVKEFFKNNYTNFSLPS